MDRFARGPLGQSCSAISYIFLYFSGSPRGPCPISDRSVVVLGFLFKLLVNFDTHLTGKLSDEWIELLDVNFNS